MERFKFHYLQKYLQLAIDVYVHNVAPECVLNIIVLSVALYVYLQVTLQCLE